MVLPTVNFVLISERVHFLQWSHGTPESMAIEKKRNEAARRVPPLRPLQMCVTISLFELAKYENYQIRMYWLFIISQNVCYRLFNNCFLCTSIFLRVVQSLICSPFFKVALLRNFSTNANLKFKESYFWDITLCSPLKSADVSEEHVSIFMGMYLWNDGSLSTA
jgi:hypothetical protein